MFRLLRYGRGRLTSHKKNVGVVPNGWNRSYGPLIQSLRQMSIDTETGTPQQKRFAVIDHSAAYENAMKGPHGKQLALAQLEGIGKDDPVFDPFKGEEDDEDFEEEEEDYEDDVEEAEFKDLEENDDGDDEYDDAEDENLEETEFDYSRYRRDGSVRRKKSVTAMLGAGFPAGGFFAVIELGGAQHKVTVDDLLVVNRLKPVDTYKVGSVHTLEDVLLAGSSHKTLVGMPTVAGAQVDLMVEEITRDKKVIVFKKRRRKHSERKNGFRRDVTLLRVLDIRMPEEFQDHDHLRRDLLDELEYASGRTIGKEPTFPRVSSGSRNETDISPLEKQEAKA